MERKSIAQEYYMLVTDKYGMLPSMQREESGAGIAAAALMDLLSAGIIAEEKKKVEVVKDLPYELSFLQPLYVYLREKHRYVNKIMTDWYTGSRCRQLMELIGKSLQETGLTKEEEGGVFRPKKVYIPVKEYEDELTGRLKAAAAAEEDMEPADMALLSILKESKNLNRLFSKDEKAQVEKRIREIKDNPQNEELAGVIRYITFIEEIYMYIFLAVIVLN